VLGNEPFEARIGVEREPDVVPVPFAYSSLLSLWISCVITNLSKVIPKPMSCSHYEQLFALIRYVDEI
jgi:hypothetical protein